MTYRIEDLNRRNINFASDKIRELLPEHFQSEYPNLISFLETYYEHLNSVTDDGFKAEINNLFAARDIEQTTLEHLDQLIEEIGNGLQVASFFKEPRLMIKLLSSFYRSKGTLVSIEGFFRSFYNTEVLVEYPKKQIFIVGESQIGSESNRFLTDNKLYQIFSILIKSGISVADYQDLYKKFVHPAGFYFAGQIELESEFSLGLNTAPGVENPLDSSSVSGIIASEAQIEPIGRFEQITGLVDSSDGRQIRIELNQEISLFDDFASNTVDGIYENIADIITPNSFTFDDSANTTGPDMSSTLENMDNNIFTRYTSDSSI